MGEGLLEDWALEGYMMMEEGYAWDGVGEGVTARLLACRVMVAGANVLWQAPMVQYPPGYKS